MRELRIEATIENLDRVLAFIEEELGDCSPKLQMQLNIAVEEIFTNIAHYAYEPETGEAFIRIEVANDTVIIEFEDNGTPHNPLLKDDPNITLSAEDRAVGGLGIFMVKQIADTIEYHYENGKNVLCIKRSAAKE
ncbi:histidine kinase [Clostridia bacterium]|nr:histidine kinase [Clostridia bacterium]